VNAAQSMLVNCEPWSEWIGDATTADDDVTVGVLLRGVGAVTVKTPIEPDRT